MSAEKPTAEQREIAQLRAQVAMLTDTVVMAACLVFEQFESNSKRDYASETLHTTACDLIKANPRLEGAFTPET